MSSPERNTYNAPYTGDQLNKVAFPLGGIGAGVMQFVLEGGEQAKPGLAFKVGQGLPQKISWAAQPWVAVGFEHVAEEEMFARHAVTEVDVDLGRRVGLEQHIAPLAERAVGDVAKGGDVDIGRRPADAVGKAVGQILGGKPSAPHQPGNIAIAGEYQVFAVQGVLPWPLTPFTAMVRLCLTTP